MKTGIIIQARRNSKRFPNKVLAKVCGDMTMLELIIYRLKTLGLPICVATTMNPEDAEICRTAKFNGCRWYRGSEDDVLQRIIDAAIICNFDNVIRVCADNPFIEPNFIEIMLKVNELGVFDYITFRIGKTNAIQHKIGLFSEIISLKTLKKTKKEIEKFEMNNLSSEEKSFVKTAKMNVSEWIYKILNNDFNIAYTTFPEEIEKYLEDVTLSIDYPHQINIVRKMLEKINMLDGWKKICQSYQEIKSS